MTKVEIGDTVAIMTGDWVAKRPLTRGWIVIGLSGCRAIIEPKRRRADDPKSKAVRTNLLTMTSAGRWLY